MGHGKTAGRAPPISETNGFECRLLTRHERRMLRLDEVRAVVVDDWHGYEYLFAPVLNRTTVSLRLSVPDLTSDSNARSAAPASGPASIPSR